MKNFVQPGRTITATAPAGGVSSGDGFLFGALFGVAATDAAAGAPVEAATEGVFTLPKLSTAVIAAGAAVAWDAANGRVDVPGTGRFPIGIATEARGNGTATVPVRLDGVATSAAA
jgi:predicted RecA/RadA family phage recombinase